jgi:hypothetical protein
MSRCAGNHLPATRIFSGPKSLKSLGPKLVTGSQAESLWNNLSTDPDLAPSYFHLFELSNTNLAGRDLSTLRREASRPHVTVLRTSISSAPGYNLWCLSGGVEVGFVPSATWVPSVLRSQNQVLGICVFVKFFWSFFMFPFVKRILKNGNMNTTYLVYTSLVRPIIEYVAACWAPCREEHINALDRVQKKDVQFTNHTKDSDWEPYLLSVWR